MKIWSQKILAGPFAAMIGVSSALAQTVPCEGSYSVLMGPVVMSGGMVGRGAEDMGIAQIAVQSCGRKFTFDLGGKLGFAQSVFDDQTYEGGFTGGDGATRTYTLTLAGPKTMIGGLVAQDQDMSVTRTITLTAVDVRPPNLTDCQADAAGEGLPDRATTAAEAGLQNAMISRGLTPPASTDLTFSDYTNGSGHSGSGQQRASILLSADGAFLPRLTDGDVEKQLVAICAVPDAKFIRAQYMMHVKAFRYDGKTNIFLRIIDIETGNIIKQHEAVVTGEDEVAIASGINEAWTALDWPTTIMSSGLLVK